MKASRLLLVVAALLITTHRLPAPIVEEQKPTPAPSQSETPKRKHSIRSTSSSEQSLKQTESKPKATPSSAPTKKFAGKWSGIMPEVPWGDIQTELIVDPTETTMSWEDSLDKNRPTVKTQLNGNTISAHFPGWPKAVWYITPNSDGQTAKVRLTAFMNDDHAVFRRVSP